MNAAAYHKEFMDRNSLSRPLDFYQQIGYLSEKTDDNNLMKIMGLEFLGMLRTGMDMRIEYDNSDELKRLRETYIYHALDYVLQERERVI